MKIHSTLLFLLISTVSFSQNSGQVPKGSIGFSFHAACPQGELRDIEYNDGVGWGISYLTRRYPYQSKVNFQVGGRLDWSAMGAKSFKDIELEDPNIIGLGTIRATNKMFGAFLEGRISFGTDNDRLVPYIGLYAGHRNFKTDQLLSLDKPNENPLYITDTLTQRVIFTKRFHYGLGGGFSYRLNQNVSIEAGFMYTLGEVGAVLPIKSIVRLNEGNEIDYNNYQSVHTDMLILQVGIRFNLFKTYSYTPYREPTTATRNTPSNTRYKDTPTTRTRDVPVINDRKRTGGSGTRPTPTPTKKVPIKVKPNGPTRDKNDS